MLDGTRVVELVAQLFRADWNAESDCIILRSVNVEIPAVEIRALFSEAQDLIPLEGLLAVAADDWAEILMQRNRITRPMLRDGLDLPSAEEGISYSLGPASPAFSIYLLMQAEERGILSGALPLRSLAPFRSGFSGMRERGAESSTEWLTDGLRRVLGFETLKIRSDKKTPRSKWKALGESFYFHVGFNLDLPAMPQRSLQEAFRVSKITRVRRSRLSELEAPRRRYDEDLVHHYQLGVSTESPMLAYISYYHVLEHWFEQIYMERLTEEVRTHITGPSFSYRKDKDIVGLVKFVSSKVKERDDGYVINELGSLELTLRKYVDIRGLVDELYLFDADLIGYYAGRKVGFSDGDAVDLRLVNVDAVYKNLAKRIYKTRNAIVHSKNGTKGRFVPFKHDRDLEMEVPLVRFIAERVIIESSMLP